MGKSGGSEIKIDWAAVFSLEEPVKTRAAKALGRVIGVPWSDEKTETALTLAQFTSADAVDQALGVDAKAAVETDPDILGRTSARLLSEALLTQTNREAIALKASEQILTRTKGRKATEGPLSESWLLAFTARAERAADPMMQQIWAAALTFEVLAPGSVGIPLIDCLHRLGERELGLVNKFAPMIIGDDFLPVGSGDLTQLKALFELESLGFISGVGSTMAREGEIDETGVLWFGFGEEALLVQGEPGAKWRVPGVIVSPMMVQLARMLDIERGRSGVINLARIVLDQPGEHKVMRAALRREGKEMHLEPQEVYHATRPDGVEVTEVRE